MSNKISVILDFPQNIDPIQVFASLSKIGINTSVPNQEALDVLEYQRIIKEYGLTKIFSINTLCEEVLPHNISVPLLIQLIKDRIDNLSPSNELLIIDNYIFPKKHTPNYTNDLLTILKNIAVTIKKLTFITLPNYDLPTFQDVQNKIKAINSHLCIEIKSTSIFHDRFWIADQERGIFIGTSINGLGNKYAIFDYISPEDILNIIKILKSERILSSSLVSYDKAAWQRVKKMLARTLMKIAYALST